MHYFVTGLLILLLIMCIIKKKNAYSIFCVGAKKGALLAFDLFPYITSIMLFISLMQISGATSIVIKVLSPILNFVGIAPELCEFVCLRPLTASGSLSIIFGLIDTYGANSLITKTACLMYLTTESVFFSSAIYLSKTKQANPLFVVSLSFFLCFFAMILCANLAKILL